MKRLAVISSLLLLCSLAFAAEPPVPSPLAARTPEMSTAGKVLEISETQMVIERTLKGKVETMVFTLAKPFPEIAVGDQVRVSYALKEGQNVLIRVSPASKTAVPPPAKKPAPASKR